MSACFCFFRGGKVWGSVNYVHCLVYPIHEGHWIHGKNLKAHPKIMTIIGGSVGLLESKSKFDHQAIHRKKSFIWKYEDGQKPKKDLRAVFTLITISWLKQRITGLWLQKYYFCANRLRLVGLPEIIYFSQTTYQRKSPATPTIKKFFG